PDGGVPEPADCLAVAPGYGRLLASPRLAGDDRFDRQWRDLGVATGFRALLTVPLASPRSERPGLVIVFFEEERLFVDDDLELARHLGETAGGALERSELFEAER